jgi:hypothetical protein
VTATVILFKPSGKFYTEEQWRIPEGAIGPWDMERSPDFRRIARGPVLITGEPWGFPHLFPAEPARIDRETMIEAFEDARVVNSDFVALEGGWTVPRDDEAERMADVAIAAIIKAEGGLA